MELEDYRRRTILPQEKLLVEVAAGAVTSSFKNDWTKFNVIGAVTAWQCLAISLIGKTV